MRMQFMKGSLLIATAGICVASLLMNPLHAENGGGTEYLRIISENTTTILTKVNNLPNYINTMMELALNLQKEDDSTQTSEMQTNFATLGSQLAKNYAMQEALQSRLNTEMSTQIPKMPDVNQLFFSSLFAAYDPNTEAGKAAYNSAYNYLKNSSGIGLIGQFPSAKMTGYQADVYRSYFNAITAIKSYNGYILSARLSEMLNGNVLSPSQTALAMQASNSSWIANIATEELGKVLRQMLLFQSQTYVLLTDMMQTQKQLLIAQAMTNTLLIINNRPNEEKMYNAASSRG